jgi:hypothetical protein
MICLFGMFDSCHPLGFSKGWKETFMSGEQEPWVFRGGLTADLQVCGNAARAQVAYLLGLDFSLLYSEWKDTLR